MPEALARALEFMSYVRVSSSFDSNIGVVEPDIRSKTNAGVMVGRTLVETSGGEVSVVVANFSREPQKIKEGELLGLCQEVDHEWHQWKVCKRSVVKEDDNLPDHVHDLFLRSCQCLDDSQVSPLRELLMEFADIFSTSDLDLGCTDMVEHSIDTGDHRPIKQPARRMAPAQWQEMEKVKKNIRSQGVIEKSSSPWTSAVVLVRKKDGSVRCCVDYRALNEVTVKDAYPLPRIDDTLDALSGAKWFSTLDMKAGYHQVKVAEKDSEKTAFSYGWGLWQIKVMPFGLCNAPATFEHLMDRVLEGLHWQTALIYHDDVIVFGQTFDQELERLSEVFNRIRAAHLKLNPQEVSLVSEGSEVPGTYCR
ncbi:hypothetical protein Pcinc_009791 [Petrolisthes cinctipes]|uniref:Reverse transcriptase domain-containing protein n=1 Tax=Petrolisthes cinctipes TaxID=88211 RepID=A0AAE1KY23_PETCI|nr:hypothetical protein Pcinc_009791 [Petrolisthes cinctipes]